VVRLATATPARSIPIRILFKDASPRPAPYPAISTLLISVRWLASGLLAFGSDGLGMAAGVALAIKHDNSSQQ
jgi:hypothetical protein